MTYAIQRTTNLAPPVVWQNLGSITTSNSVGVFRDTGATSPSFYRVVIE
jgi:hypothetical protein